MRKPAPIFCNPTRQTELIIGCRFVFDVYLRREHAKKALRQSSGVFTSHASFHPAGSSRPSGMPRAQRSTP
eukprot:scaffold26290_cov57-Phaeocystis_antarctica.AAC.2